MFGPVWSCSPNRFGAPSSQQGWRDGRMAYWFSPNFLYALDIMVTIGQGFIDFFKGPFFPESEKPCITITSIGVFVASPMKDSTSMKPGRTKQSKFTNHLKTPEESPEKPGRCALKRSNSSCLIPKIIRLRCMSGGVFLQVVVCAP